MDVDRNSDHDPEPKARQMSEGFPPRASSLPPNLQVSKLTVGYVYSADMMQHYSPHGHPEQPERISRIMQALKAAHYHIKMKRLSIRPVRRDEALLVHTEDHWDKVQAIQSMTPLDILYSEAYYEHLSLYVMQGTTQSARLSCGGVIEACLAVARNELKKAFAIVRPPGHHAEPDEHMGFCFFNNVAVAARVVQQLTPIRKIMILDWDVHHGNGTQRAFYDDRSVLYVSLHRYDNGQFYPCGPFGSMQSCGEGPGLGYSVNIPWPEKGMGDADYIYAFQRIVMPIAMEFAPELVIISAGFDAAIGDELGECFVTPTGYAHMTHMLSSLAGGRLVVALEGGYNLDSISQSALAVTKVILGEPPGELPPMVATDIATQTIWQVALQQSRYWKNIDPKGCEPRETIEPITFSIPEILKAHRQHYLYTTHNMMQIPLMTDEDEERFGTQIMCTPDIMENKTMIIFIHEFGNLRLELESVSTCDVQLENSYLIDVSKQLVAWVNNAGYSLLDVNLFPKPFSTATNSKSSCEYGNDIITYLWDNYAYLSDAEDIILIGHSAGCLPLMHLLAERTMNAVKLVKAVIQIMGHAKLPFVPRQPDELRSWYFKHSYVIVPTNHHILSPEAKKEAKRHGRISTIDEPQAVKLMMRALPFIETYIKQELETLMSQDPIPPLRKEILYPFYTT